jgi:hypothetical protein
MSMAIAASTLLRADEIVKSLTGLSPKHVDSGAYKAATQAASELHHRYDMTGEEPMTEEEVAMVKLIAHYVIAHEAGLADKCQVFGKAISALRRTANAKVRADIALSAMSDTGY